LFAAARSHSFAQLAAAIDDAFARWDRSHLHVFQQADGTRIGTPDPDSDNEGVLDETRENLSRLHTTQQFTYVFDFGVEWTHLCTVIDAGIDPRDVLGVIPNGPLAYFGWGNIPDQYGRLWADEDAESATPFDPELADLPRLRPGWGPRS
jgi:Plasmid pRiA4b ORF-3-like protein